LPGRVCGETETVPARSGADKILLLRQGQLPDVAVLPAGMVLIGAAPFSHAVIQWLGRGIPLALMDADRAAHWAAGQPVVLDSARGALYERRGVGQPAPWRPPPSPEPGVPVRTSDGEAIHLRASISSPTAARRALAHGAEGIGLVRSEYLLPADPRPPDAAFYEAIYAELLTLTAPLVLTIRLLDLAADKWPSWLPRFASGDALCDLHGSQLYGHPSVEQVVRAQVSASTRVGPEERLRLIWPSGGSLEDFLRWREQARSAWSATLPIGAMVETPVEMLGLDQWSAEADFVSVGCNDLLANLFGVDRDKPQQGRLLDPYRPGLYRFLGEACRRAGSKLGRTQLCGLLPQIEGILPVLIGLGFRRFSGEPTLIPLLARDISRLSLRACERLAEAVCGAKDGREVREMLGLSMEGPWGLVTPRTRGMRPAPDCSSDTDPGSRLRGGDQSQPTTS
jgi:phosphoenolpyruvate-protein kinase (PTS system EI component)